MKINPINAIDFYKADHRRQYPAGTERVYSNFTPRIGTYAWTGLDYIIFFGLQAFVKDFLIDTWNEEFFAKDKDTILAKYKKRMDGALGPDAVPVEHIGELHDLGYLPIKIKALPEGTKVPYGVPVLTIINTIDKFFWLTNYLESVMSAELWKPSTSATMAHTYHKRFLEHCEKTGSPVDFVGWQGHDFSFRGMGGIQDAAASGAGHLLSFTGTDTVSAIDYHEKFYAGEKTFVGGSVPATEHSVMCMGSKEGELETFKRLITEVYPAGLVSIVSDTWDFWQVISEFLPSLKDTIMAREGRVVIRPDSGDPVKIICGEDFHDFKHAKEMDYAIISNDIKHARFEGKFYKLIRTNKRETFPDLTWVEKEILSLGDEVAPEMFYGAYESLWNTFGGTMSAEGYKLLDGHIGLIYGDSITLERQDEILKRLEAKGFTASNLVLGIGSYTYQYCTRDSHGFAMKATWGQVNGEARDIFKDPKTGTGFKKSAKGLLSVKRGIEGLFLKDECTIEEEREGELQVVLEDGLVFNLQTLEEIRARVNS